jgi:predicted nucleotidyltransferase
MKSFQFANQIIVNWKFFDKISTSANSSTAIIAGFLLAWSFVSKTFFILPRELSSSSRNVAVKRNVVRNAEEHLAKIHIFETMNLIDQNINIISRLCETHKVNHLYAFGSILTNKFSDKSDVDLIVDFKDVELLKYADNYFDFKFSLEDIFQRPIDLLEEKAIKNPYFKQSIDSQKKLIYG